MENEPEIKQPQKSRSFGRIIAIVAVAMAFVGLILISNAQKQTSGDQLWNKEMSVGSLKARNLYIMYTDLLCPYCETFAHATVEHWDEFTEYLAKHDILFEVRLTDALYEGNGYKASRDAAEAAYCARNEDKFWEYYHNAVMATWEGSIKATSDLPDNYWAELGHQIGLGAEFDNCLEHHATRDEITDNTYRALQVTEGMPSFKFNKFVVSGFNDAWGWDYVLKFLDAGLESK